MKLVYAGGNNPRDCMGFMEILIFDNHFTILFILKRLLRESQTICSKSAFVSVSCRTKIPQYQRKHCEFRQRHPHNTRRQQQQ